MTKRVAIIGAGPIGLETAARAIGCGFHVTVFECGEVGENVRSWGHVAFFSPFGLNRSPWGVHLLQARAPNMQTPADDALITGAAYVRDYLSPLAQALSAHCDIQTGTRVIAMGREGSLKHDHVGDLIRAAEPFRLLVESNAKERIEHADIVIDASGTYGHHNHLGDGGIAAPGEPAAADAISYLLDDVAGRSRSQYANKRVLLVGGGFSAATSAVALAELAAQAPETQVTWWTRKPGVLPLHAIEDDPLAERRRLTEQANAIAASPPARFRFQSGVHVERLRPRTDGSVTVTGRFRDGSVIDVESDRILANVGYMPDRSLYRELQVHECYATFGPIRLAASILGAKGSDCLKQRSPGADVLANPEPNFYILGSKSYGRNSTFLIRVGLEQIDQLFAMLTAM